MEILLERPLRKHRLCLTQTGKRVQLELLVKTRRIKSPWDRYVVAEMVDGEGLGVCDHLNERVEPLRSDIQEMLPAFDPLAVVFAVNLR